MITTEKTLSEVMEILRQRGYTEDFNLLEVSASYTPDKHCININDLVIDKIYRFTGQNDPDDEAMREELLAEGDTESAEEGAE